MKLTALFVLALGLGACQPEQTSIAVHITASGLTFTELQLSAMLGPEQSQSLLLPATQGGRVVILLPAVAEPVTVTLRALDISGEVVGETSGVVRSVPHEQVDVTLALAGGLPMPDGGFDMARGDAQAPPDLPPPTPSLRLLAGALGGPGESDGKGAEARLTSPQGLAIAGTSIYVAEQYSGRIRKVGSDGTVTTLTLVDPQSGNVISTDNGVGLAYDGAQYLYVSEYYGCDIQRIDLGSPTATGAFPMARVSGAGGEVCGNMNGDVDTSKLNKPGAITFDSSGNLWILDELNYAVRLFAPKTGLLSTIAGQPPSSGTTSTAVDGSSTTARFGSLSCISAIGSKIYISDGSSLRVIDTTLAPTAATYVATALPSGDDGFEALAGIGPGDSGSILALDGDGLIHRIVPGAPPSFASVAGNTSFGEASDGNGFAATLVGPGFMQVDGSGNAWFTDGTTLRKLTIGAPWPVTTVAGIATHAGDSQTPPRFDMPSGLAWDATTNIVYIADYSGNRIRAFQLPSGPLTVFAGSGASGHHDDIGTAATFGGPVSLALDGAGELFVSDSDGEYIRKVTLATAQVQTVAGNGTGTLPGFYAPKGLAFDGAHAIYISDFGHNCIRTIDTVSGALATFAGVCDENSSGSANGPAASASFYGPAGLAIDPTHHLLYVADYGNRVLRKIDLVASGNPVTLLSGQVGNATYVDGTTLALATYAAPYDLAFDDASGILYVADQDNSAVRKVDLAGNRVTTYIGDGNQRTDVGPLPAAINEPYGMAPTPAGLLVTSQSENALLLAK